MNKKISNMLMVVLVIGAALIFSGTAFAQHEGGLGQKKIQLNLASAEQLTKIDGVTETIAANIIKYRTTKGFFKSPDQLKEVEGVNTAVYLKMDPQKGAEGDVFCVPVESEDDEDEYDDDDEDIPLSPSKC